MGVLDLCSIKMVDSGKENEWGNRDGSRHEGEGICRGGRHCEERSRLGEFEYSLLKDKNSGISDFKSRCERVEVEAEFRFPIGYNVDCLVALWKFVS